MSGRFEGFVILASMRTGSNFLEEALAAVPGLACYGEAFNPGFIGRAGVQEMLGITLSQRTRDPMALLGAMRAAAAPGLPGFRLFPGHEARVQAQVLADPRWAKIILSRNPAETYVSRKIAQQTGQWQLRGFRNRRAARINFEAAEFEAHLAEVQAARLEIERALQTSGQTAFHINYDDLGDLEIFNGLLRFLGIEERVEALSSRLRKQNPAAMPENVINFSNMEEVAARLDPFQLSRLPDLEPRRGPGVQGFVASARPPVLFMPIAAGTPRAALEPWLAGLGGEGPDEGADKGADKGAESPLERGFTRKVLGGWLAANPGHVAFTIVSHPLVRAHAAFCAQVLPGAEAPHAGLRRHLEDMLGVAPAALKARGASAIARQRAAFLGFLSLVAAAHAGQIGLRIDPRWAGQVTLLRGMAELRPPDAVLRAEHLAQDLAALAARHGWQAPAFALPAAPVNEQAVPLAALYDAEVEAAARAAFALDYQLLGYGDWQPAP